MAKGENKCHKISIAFFFILVFGKGEKSIDLIVF